MSAPIDWTAYEQCPRPGCRRPTGQPCRNLSRGVAAFLDDDPRHDTVRPHPERKRLPRGSKP